MNDYIEKICDLNKIWAYVICLLYGFCEPIGALLLWLFIFIFVDLVSGVIVSLKEGRYMTSDGLRKSVVKLVCYLLAIILTEGISRYMLGWDKPTKFVSTLLCGIELYSIFENFYLITGHRSFRILTQFTLRTLEDKTGVDLRKET